MICKECGKEIADDINFCPYCGSKIENTDKTEEEPETGFIYHKGDYAYSRCVSVNYSAINNRASR